MKIFSRAIFEVVKVNGSKTWNLGPITKFYLYIICDCHFLTRNELKLNFLWILRAESKNYLHNLCWESKLIQTLSPDECDSMVPGGLWSF